ncbi:MAG: protein kinase [Lachnospiraceae bacterium]|nr:protein kinase [Lachnospiraceae bacterium]
MARRGEIIDGKYEVLREIGRGGMSIVYLAMDKRLNKQWAIKEFRKDKDDASKQVALKALLDEANLMKKFDHPTLPRIVDIIDQSQNVYVIMDYIEGESLNKVLDAYGAQPQEAVIEWAKQLSEVLDYLHTQSPPVIYRDMKPANIMLKPDGSVRLIDFGIAREWKEGKAGDTEAIGTRGYAAPEQFGGQGQTDARTDIYSFGVTLYHLVTGKNPAEPPYEIYPIRHWNPSLSSGLEWMIQKCTQLNPNDRYQSCAEITYVLENLDKFEVEYKKKLKSKIHYFMTAAIMTVVFTISSAGCFAGANSIKSNTYQTLIEQGDYAGYKQAIEQDEDNPEAYRKLADYIEEKRIYESEPEGGLPEDAMLSADIDKCLTSSRKTHLKEEYPEDYAYVCYKIGKRYWNEYEGANGDKYASISKSRPYFEGVLEAASNERADETAGLKEQKYTLSEMYYLISFFWSKKDEMARTDDGDFEVGDEIARNHIEGINDDGTLSNPYYSFWNTNQRLLDYMSGGDKEVDDVVKAETLEKLVYILQENSQYFYAKTKNKEERVTSEEMVEFVNQIKDIILNDLKTYDDPDDPNKIDNIKENLNRAIDKINADKNNTILIEGV